MSLAALKKRLPIPAKPEATPDAGWEIVEGVMGQALPADYKSFIDEYGAGSLGDFLWVLSPFAAEPAGQLVRETLARLDDLALFGRVGAAPRISSADAA